ncbi:MAG: surface protein [Vicingaceae bacterium]|jgi:surface protein
MKINLLLVFTAILLSGVLNDLKAQKDSTQLVSTWKTNNNGISNDSSILINTDTNYTYNYDVDWNDDGVFDSLGVTGNITHQYNDTGIYTIRIRGVFPSIKFGGQIIQDREKLVSFDQWGTAAWLDVEQAFYNCNNMTYAAADVPNLSIVTSTKEMFFGALNFNGNINNWNVSNIQNMRSMFFDCFVFNQPLNNWDVSSVTNFYGFLGGAYNFNQPINNWDVSSAIDMTAMFGFAANFNQPLNNWDVSSVTTMFQMFVVSYKFNQPINNWDVSSVIDMSQMFSFTDSFNRPLDNWQVDSVQNMASMFRRADRFDQNLANWNIVSVNNMVGMFDGSILSVANYDNLLRSWQTKPHQLNINFGVQGLNYCNGDSARFNLIADGWTFSGDSLNCITVGLNDEIGMKAVEDSAYDLFEVYPNPSHGVLTIKFIEENKLEIAQLFTYSGQLVKELYLNETENILSLKDLTKGMYFIKIKGQTKKVIIH